MTDPVLLAVDQGSQSTKVAVVDPAGTVLARGRAPLRPLALGPQGRATHPDDDLWDSLVTACRSALAAFGRTGGDVRRVAALGLCGIRFCRALVGSDGQLTQPVLSWMDDRVSAPLDPADIDGVDLVTSAGGYLARRLTGQRRDADGNMLGTWPLDVRTRRWDGDPSAYDRTGMPRHLLPDLVGPGEVLGEVTTQVARELGLPTGVPVVATGNDKAVEALGAGLLRPGQMLLSLGTYIAGMTPVRGDVDLPDGDPRVWRNLHAIPNLALAESAGIRRGMWTVSWLRDLATSGTDERVDPDEVLARLEAGAREVAPGSEGLLTVPDWLAPVDQPHRRGVLLGLTGTHDQRHLYRSLLEGILLTMRAHLTGLAAALAQPGEPSGATVWDSVLVSGGGSRSGLIMEMVADTTGRPAQRPAEPDAAGMGAAVCAAVGAGWFRDFPSAVTALVRPGEVVEPDPERVAAYRRVAEAYDAVPGLLDPALRHLHESLRSGGGARGGP